nr:substrate-binding domain-containing protein [Ruania alba]
MGPGRSHRPHGPRFWLRSTTWAINATASPDARSRALIDLGLVVPDIVMPYFGRLAQAISSLAFTQGLELLVATTDWDLAKEQANLRALVERRVEGIIVVSVDRHQDFGPYTAMGTPIVVVDRPEFAVRGSALVTQHLISHGHKKIALLGGPEGIVSTQRRYEGWRDVMAENHLHSGDDYVVAAPLTEPGGYDAVEQLLAMDPAPTAALVATDVQAFGVLRRLYERGVAVPAIWHSPSPTRQNLPSSQCPR